MLEEVGLIDLGTGEMFTMADVDLSEYQVKMLAEFQEWDVTRKLCQQHNLPLGVREAYRKMDFIRRDFLWESVKVHKLIGIRLS